MSVNDAYVLCLVGFTQGAYHRCWQPHWPLFWALICWAPRLSVRHCCLSWPRAAVLSTSAAHKQCTCCYHTSCSHTCCIRPAGSMHLPRAAAAQACDSMCALHRPQTSVPSSMSAARSTAPAASRPAAVTPAASGQLAACTRPGLLLLRTEQHV